MEEQLIIQYFMGLLTQIKLYHWATMSYVKHKALDELHGSLSDKIDDFVESYIGKFKKQPLKKFVIKAEATTDMNDAKTIEKFLDVEHSKIVEIQKVLKSSTELVNIIDEMLSAIDKAQYLCKLS